MNGYDFFWWCDRSSNTPSGLPIRIARSMFAILSFQSMTTAFFLNIFSRNKSLLNQAFSKPVLTSCMWWNLNFSRITIFNFWKWWRHMRTGNKVLTLSVVKSASWQLNQSQTIVKPKPNLLDLTLFFDFSWQFNSFWWVWIQCSVIKFLSLYWRFFEQNNCFYILHVIDLIWTKRLCLF